jgi:hypothetical protein
MDLTHATLPGAVGDLHFGIGYFTGWDRVFASLLPAEYMRRRAGRKILRVFGHAAPEKRITFTMPGDPRVWEVRCDGRVMPWRLGRGQFAPA